MDTTSIIALCGIVVTFVVSLVTAMWRQGTWLTTQFTDVKDFVNIKIDGVMDKLEYHERHDDSRFSNLNEALWTVRLDNAQNQRLYRQDASNQKNKDSFIRRAPEASDAG